MVTKGIKYVNPAGYLFLDQKRKLGLVKRIQKQITKFGLTSKDLEVVFFDLQRIRKTLVRILERPYN
jgi:hypothetical protein